MASTFEIKIPAMEYRNGTKNSEIFKNAFGAWTINIDSGSRHAFTGTVEFEPAVDKELIDPKKIQITVNRNDKQGYNYNSSLSAQHHDEFTFNFGPFPSTNSGYTNMTFDIKVKIEMPGDLMSLVNAHIEKNGVRVHLKKMFETGDDSDITIKSKENELKVHKFIMLRSEVFSKMLTETTKEGQSGEIAIEDIKHEVIMEMCRFLYYDEAHDMETHALDLLVAADKYMIHALATKCEIFLMQNITITNFLDILTVSDKLNKDKLRGATIDFIIENRATIFQSTDWNDLKKNNMPLAMQVMEKFMLTTN